MYKSLHKLKPSNTCQFSFSAMVSILLVALLLLAFTCYQICIAFAEKKSETKAYSPYCLSCHIENTQDFFLKLSLACPTIQIKSFTYFDRFGIPRGMDVHPHLLDIQFSKYYYLHSHAIKYVFHSCQRKLKLVGLFFQKSTRWCLAQSEAHQIKKPRPLQKTIFL